MAERIKVIYQRPGCKLVCLNNGESFKVPLSLFKLSPLRAGDEVEMSGYLEALRPHENRHALEQAVRYLEAKDRSFAELRGKLTQAGYCEEAARAACDTLKQLAYLDDRRFAGQSLQRLGKKYGALRIRQELRQKGIDKPLIDSLLEEQDESESLEAAVSLVQKAARARPGDPQGNYRRAYGMLARRGFPPPLVQKALKIVFADATSEISDA